MSACVCALTHAYVHVQECSCARVPEADVIADVTCLPLSLSILVFEAESL